MKILSIDTSSAACSVALLIDEEITATHKLIPMQQAQNILPMIENLLSSKNISFNQMDALAFGCGPGSFTGVRIAASVIQGLGYGLNLPIISISSLAALAQQAYEDLHWKKLLVGIDARIQEVYCAAYEVNSEGFMSLVGNEIVCRPEDFIIPKGNDWYGVGNAWEVYTRDIPFQPLEIDITRVPTASAVVRLARMKYLSQEWLSPAEALPVYLRDSVAKKPKI